MKKDILAAVTFLTAALVFYAVQTDGKTDQHFSSGFGCEAAETAIVEKTAPEVQVPVFLDDEVTRDS